MNPAKIGQSRAHAVRMCLRTYSSSFTVRSPEMLIPGYGPISDVYGSPHKSGTLLKANSAIFHLGIESIDTGAVSGENHESDRT